MSILVTGGAGFIGSHTVVELVEHGYDVVIVDNFINSDKSVIKRIEKIVQKEIKYYNCDLRNYGQLRKIFLSNQFDSCIHFAGLKSVGESVCKSLEYYNNNISGTITLLSVMQEFDCKKIIFSSSATVYDEDGIPPFTEQATKGRGTNPYARTKIMLEDILRDVYVSDETKNVSNKWKMIFLRYFNPIGAHKSGLLGEMPNGIPNNLMPYITQVATGKLPMLKIYGNDYDTPDGTCIRDYIHVVDLALGHIKALDHIDKLDQIGVYNLGTGKGYSVLEVVKAFEQANDLKIPYIVTDRRIGDIPISYSDPSKAYEELKWKHSHDLLDMCRDSWRWQLSFNEFGNV